MALLTLLLLLIMWSSHSEGPQLGDLHLNPSPELPSHMLEVHLRWHDLSLALGGTVKYNMAGLEELGPGESLPQTRNYREGNFQAGRTRLRGRGRNPQDSRFESIRLILSKK